MRQQGLRHKVPATLTAASSPFLIQSLILSGETLNLAAKSATVNPRAVSDRGISLPFAIAACVDCVQFVPDHGHGAMVKESHCASEGRWVDVLSRGQDMQDTMQGNAQFGSYDANSDKLWR